MKLALVMSPKCRFGGQILNILRTSFMDGTSLAEGAAVLINKLHARYISNSALPPSLLTCVSLVPCFESLFPVTRVMVSYSSSDRGSNTSKRRPAVFFHLYSIALLPYNLCNLGKESSIPRFGDFSFCCWFPLLPQLD